MDLAGKSFSDDFTLERELVVAELSELVNLGIEGLPF
jgi:hypothetical protein